MSNVICQLPWPPSANHAWRPTASGGKILSTEYRCYKKAVGDTVLEHHVKRFWTKDRLAVAMLLQPPNSRDYDIDNRVKCCLDALAGAGVIENDKLVDLLLVRRGLADPPRGGVFVRIEEMSNLPIEFGVNMRGFEAVFLGADWTREKKTAILGSGESSSSR